MASGCGYPQAPASNSHQACACQRTLESTDCSLQLIICVATSHIAHGYKQSQVGLFDFTSTEETVGGKFSLNHRHWNVAELSRYERLAGRE